MQVKTFQFFSHLLHELILAVVALRIRPHQSHISMEFLRHLVNPCFQFELYGLQVDRTADCLIVPWGAIPNLVNGLQKWEDLLVGFQPTEDGTLPVELPLLLLEALTGGLGLQLLGEVLQLFSFLDGRLEDLALGKEWDGLGDEGFFGSFLRGAFWGLIIRLFLRLARWNVLIGLLLDFCRFTQGHFLFYRNQQNFQFFRILSQQFVQTDHNPLFFPLLLSLHHSFPLFFSSRNISPHILLQTILTRIHLRLFLKGVVVRPAHSGDSLRLPLPAWPAEDVLTGGAFWPAPLTLDEGQRVLEESFGTTRLSEVVRNREEGELLREVMLDEDPLRLREGKIELFCPLPGSR